MNNTTTNNEIYTNLDTAILEIKRRADDLKLRKKIDLYCKKMKITFPAFRNAVVLFSTPVATPNIVTEFFIKNTKLNNFNQLILEYSDDIFITNNYPRLLLGKLVFLEHSRTKMTRITNLNIVNFKDNNGKKIKDVRLLNNTKLPNFHHELLFSANKDMSENNIYDLSKLIYQTKKTTPDIFLEMLLLHFLQDNILFLDNTGIETGANEQNLYLEIFMKVLRRLKKRFGVQPLVIILDDKYTEIGPRGSMYDYRYKKLVTKILKSDQ